MAGFLRCARGTWEPWMTRRWDSLPATARTFCVCRRCDGRLRQFARSFTARPLIYLANTISQARDIVADWPRWYEGCPHEHIGHFKNFHPAVRNSCTTADTEGCGVGTESTVYTETSSTAACVYAPFC
ncbi:hypothetical protein TcCL_Unassigned04457 [Trypanosoma cruzi]|nr:hypothetical protein TcCL_Unassigned04457 [Trypanosoma cruzi]